MIRVTWVTWVEAKTCASESSTEPATGRPHAPHATGRADLAQAEHTRLTEQVATLTAQADAAEHDRQELLQRVTDGLEAAQQMRESDRATPSPPRSTPRPPPPPPRPPPTGSPSPKPASTSSWPSCRPPDPTSTRTAGMAEGEGDDERRDGDQ